MHTRGAHEGADTAPRRMTRTHGGEVAADAAATSDSTTTAALDPMVVGERRLAGEGEWYQRVEGVIANLGVYLRVVEDNRFGRRRASSGGEVRLLSGKATGEVPAARLVAGGRSGDGGLGDVLHGGRASTTAAQSKL